MIETLLQKEDIYASFKKGTPSLLVASPATGNQAYETEILALKTALFDVDVNQNQIFKTKTLSCSHVLLCQLHKFKIKESEYVTNYKASNSQMCYF
jgi:hypothetical protein